MNEDTLFYLRYEIERLGLTLGGALSRVPSAMHIGCRYNDGVTAHTAFGTWQSWREITNAIHQGLGWRVVGFDYSRENNLIVFYCGFSFEDVKTNLPNVFMLECPLREERRHHEQG